MYRFVYNNAYIYIYIYKPLSIIYVLHEDDTGSGSAMPGVQITRRQTAAELAHTQTLHPPGGVSFSQGIRRAGS